MVRNAFEKREGDRLSKHYSRSRSLGLVANLILGDWQETIQDFNELCAYCQAVPYTCIDHFIPVAEKGPTTVDNCVPCCVRCNRKKGDSHPDMLESADSFDIDGVRVYLSKRQARDETYWINIEEWYSLEEASQLISEASGENRPFKECIKYMGIRTHYLSYAVLYSKADILSACKRIKADREKYKKNRLAQLSRILDDWEDLGLTFEDIERVWKERMYEQTQQTAE